MMTLVHFPQAPAAHPSAHVPPVGAAVEAFLFIGIWRRTAAASTEPRSIRLLRLSVLASP